MRLKLKANKRFILGDGASDTIPGLWDLYIDSQFEILYQLASYVVEIYPTLNEDKQEDFYDINLSCKMALSDYQEAHDKRDFAKLVQEAFHHCSWV